MEEANFWMHVQELRSKVEDIEQEAILDAVEEDLGEYDYFIDAWMEEKKSGSQLKIERLL